MFYESSLQSLPVSFHLAGRRLSETVSDWKEARKVKTDLPYEKSACPYCGHTGDHSQSHSETIQTAADIKPGDFTVCSNCGLVCVLDENLQNRHPTRAEEELFISEPARVKFAQDAHLDYQRRKMLHRRRN
jgi:transcription elongation factor Elf1